MLKLLLCTVLRSVVVVASILAIPAIAVAQHSMNDHAAPSDRPGIASRDRVIAQALPQTSPPQSAMPMMPGMGQGDMHAPHIITLRSGIAGGRMVYIGVGGEIDEQINPTLQVHEGETVQINLINGEGAEHDIVLDQYAARSGRVQGKGASTSLVFTADKNGEFIYFCTIAGH